MYAALLAALGRVFSWVLGAGTMKWVVLAGLTFGVSVLISLLLDLLPVWFSADGLAGAAGAFTPQIWFFIDYFLVSEGLSLALSAWCIRFLIRRIPVVG
jgi:hypothetical protein